MAPSGGLKSAPLSWPGLQRQLPWRESCPGALHEKRLDPVVMPALTDPIGDGGAALQLALRECEDLAAIRRSGRTSRAASGHWSTPPQKLLQRSRAGLWAFARPWPALAVCD